MGNKDVVVEALEHCIKGDCSGCPNLGTEYCSTPENFQKEVLGLINRQQAEIERLTINMNAFGLGMKQEKERADTIKAKAIKEFIEEFTSRLEDYKHHDYNAHENFVYESAIDHLVNYLKKEMVGDV